MQDEARMASQPYGQKINDIRDAQTEKINQMVMDRFGIKNADNITPDVRRQMDETITNAYRKAEEGLTRTVGDEKFLTNSVAIATDEALTSAQKAQLEAVGKRINQGMDGKELMNLRKKLQKQVKNNQQSNGDFADSLNSMVSEIDDLIERTAPEGVAMQAADARTWRESGWHWRRVLPLGMTETSTLGALTLLWATYIKVSLSVAVAPRTRELRGCSMLPDLARS